MNEKLYLEDEENLGVQVDESYEQVYCRPDTLTDVPFHYCPGCGHSVVHRVLMEVIARTWNSGRNNWRCTSWMFCICL